MKGNLDLGLWYPRNTELTLEVYTYATLEGIINYQKRTGGASFFLGKCLVSWLSKKQYSVSLSIVEERYIVVVACCAQVLWMKQTPKDVQEEY